MDCRKLSVFLLLLFVSSQFHISMGAEARPVPSTEQGRYVKVLESLGIVCLCCDGTAGECRSNWESTCGKLDCHPSKFL